MKDLSAGDQVGGLSAPTLERQGDAESRQQVDRARRLDDLLASAGLDSCGRCGAIVEDMALHLDWHGPNRLRPRNMLCRGFR